VVFGCGDKQTVLVVAVRTLCPTCMLEVWQYYRHKHVWNQARARIATSTWCRGDRAMSARGAAAIRRPPSGLPWGEGDPGMSVYKYLIRFFGRIRVYGRYIYGEESVRIDRSTYSVCSALVKRTGECGGRHHIPHVGVVHAWSLCAWQVDGRLSWGGSCVSAGPRSALLAGPIPWPAPHSSLTRRRQRPWTYTRAARCWRPRAAVSSSECQRSSRFGP